MKNPNLITRFKVTENQNNERESHAARLNGKIEVYIEAGTLCERAQLQNRINPCQEGSARGSLIGKRFGESAIHKYFSVYPYLMITAIKENHG
jgi:hypothetical protein